MKALIELVSVFIGSSPVLTTKMKTSRNMEYVKTNFLSENDKLIGLSLGISKINSQVAELVDANSHIDKVVIRQKFVFNSIRTITIQVRILS